MSSTLEWVQCETCKKWRKLPSHVPASGLPDLWYCRDNIWSPLVASCEVPEETDDPVPPVVPPPVAVFPKRNPTIPVPLPKPRVASPPPSVTRAPPPAPQITHTPKVTSPPPATAPPPLPSLSSKPPGSVRESLMDLLTALDRTSAVVSRLDNQSEVFQMINRLPEALHRLHVSVAASQLTTPVPHALLEQLDFPQANHVSLFTERELRHMSGWSERLEESSKRYRAIAQDLD